VAESNWNALKTLSARTSATIFYRWGDFVDGN